MAVRHATLNQLKIFETLSRQMSITRTAEALHLTPPAVSIQVKQLSEAAGQPLFEQIGKQIYLTEAGEMVAEACRDVLERIERLSQELAQLDSMEQGHLRIAIITTSMYFIPRQLGLFSQKYPDIELSLFVGNRDEVMERLKQNMDDLYVIGEPPRGMRLNVVRFAPNRLIAAASPEHPLAQKSFVSAQDLDNVPFIIREEGSGIRLATEKYFRDNGIRLNIRMSLNRNEAIKQTVIGLLGISFFAESSVASEVKNGDLVPLNVEGLPLEREWNIVYPEQKILSPAASVFQSFLMERTSD